MKFLQPPNWPRPKGYASGVAAKGNMVFLSGIVGWNAEGRFTSSDFTEQVRQALQNIVEVLREANAKPEHIARMTWYVLDKNEYLKAAKALGAVTAKLLAAIIPQCLLWKFPGW